MKIGSIILFAILSIFHMEAQNIAGSWYGILKAKGIQLRIVFNITPTESGYQSTMDSPDQGAKGIPMNTTTFDGVIVRIALINAGIEYTGELKNDSIKGIFKQRSMEFPLHLSRDSIGKIEQKRPQNPEEPFPYYTEELTFSNSKAGIELSGTLTLPDKNGKYPVLILISGSGPQNRNEELMGHKPFLVIADYLTRNGIAVLRFDDRGVGKSTGNFKSATSADFASDVESAVAFLKTRKEINKKKIGLLGHSEGGIIAPMVASSSKDVSFIVLLAGTGIRGDKLLLMQQELIGRAMGNSEPDIQKTREINSKIFEMVVQTTDEKLLKKNLTDFLEEEIKNTPEKDKPKGLTDQELISTQFEQIFNPWMLYFLRYDPAETLEKVKCPVLALNGEKDLQVPASENLAAIEQALKKGGNKKVECIKFPNLNHLFQECKTGTPGEYAQIEQTISPVVLDEIRKWILVQAE